MRFQKIFALVSMTFFSMGSSGCLLDGLFGDDDEDMGLSDCDPYYGCARNCAFEFVMTFDLGASATTNLSSDFSTSNVGYQTQVVTTTCSDIPTGDYGMSVINSVSRVTNDLTVDTGFFPLAMTVNPATGALSSSYSVQECDSIYLEQFTETFVSGTLDDTNDVVIVRLRDAIAPCTL